MSQYQGPGPDLVLAEVNGEASLPQWLEDLTQGLPQTSVLVCSHKHQPDFLIRAMQVGVREFLPLPLKRQDLESALERVALARKRMQSGDSQQGRIIVITGHKGGVGTTTVAVNLALTLAEMSRERVALVDLGRPFPDVGNFLDQEGTHTIFDLVQNLGNLDINFIQRIMLPWEDKLAILHGCADIKEHDSIEHEVLEKMFPLLRGLYKWIIVDLSHWLDAIFLQVVKEADLVLLLSELSIPDLRNLKKLWGLFQEWDHVQEKVKLVVNRYQKINGLSLGDLEQVAQRPAYDTLPSDYPALIEAINQGRPLMSAAPRAKLCRSLQHLAQRLRTEFPGGASEAAPAPALGRKFWIFSKG
jgi:pilus assembly protein CpaE